MTNSQRNRMIMPEQALIVRSFCALPDWHRGAGLTTETREAGNSVGEAFIHPLHGRVSSARNSMLPEDMNMIFLFQAMAQFFSENRIKNNSSSSPGRTPQPALTSIGEESTHWSGVRHARRQRSGKHLNLPPFRSPGRRSLSMTQEGKISAFCFNTISELPKKSPGIAARAA